MGDPGTSTAVDAPLHFDPAPLEAYLRVALPALRGTMRVELISGGQSNPTFFLTFDNRELVLRKQPPGELLPSAHAVDREYRVMTALAETDVPVPRTLLFCADRTVTGTPFYVMERLPGRVFHDSTLPGVTAKERSAMYDSMNDVMARLHMVNWQAVGLGDYGKPGNYFARQINRWTRQWQSSRTRDIPEIDRLIEWLPAHIPPGDETTICHGDYRIGNLMFHPTEPRVVGVLDWELSTLGHPLADVAFNCIVYHSTPEEYGGIRGLDLAALGIPSEEDYLARYCDRTGRADSITGFHLAFALFRFAVIFEGIAARAKIGTAAGSNAEDVGKLSVVFARRACEMIDD
ncbi:MAG: phosphotransferase family protein [Alphaproteobacteria bacterium]|nr:phosphotransferase family protein [Alphaproteobacteria bacterium]